MLILLPLLGIWMLAMLMLWAYRGDGRRDLRRCQKCWHSLEGLNGLICPECGHAARVETELFEPRRKTRLFKGTLLLLIMSTGVWVWMVTPVPWTSKVPHAILRIALNIAEPYQDVPRNAETIIVPAPTMTYRDSDSPWERALWNQQVTNCIRRWADAALAESGPISPTELPFLIRLAKIANDSYQYTPRTDSQERCFCEDEKAKIARLRANTLDPHLKQRAEWVLGELQFEMHDRSNRMDWGETPTEIIAMCLKHEDTEVRLYGLDRVEYCANFLRLSNRFGRRSPCVSEVRQLADTDPDSRVRNQAAKLIYYIDTWNLK